MPNGGRKAAHGGVSSLESGLSPMFGGAYGRPQARALLHISLHVGRTIDPVDVGAGARPGRRATTRDKGDAAAADRPGDGSVAEVLAMPSEDGRVCVAAVVLHVPALQGAER